MDGVSVRELRLSFPPERRALEDFLRRHGLRLEDDADCAFGLFSNEDALLGCGCAAGKLLKCFAVDEALRGQNGLGALVSRLTANRFAAGFDQLFVITRPRNKALFSGCGFHPVAGTGDVVLLENRRGGAERFLRELPRAPEGVSDIGSIVMNCNPVTNGHLALIRHGAAHCAFLYLFVVEEDRSFFPFADRLELVRRATEGMERVCVCPGGPFIISAMTFPTYFLKETESPSLLQSELDVTLFGQCLAPPLGIRKRFAGQEPLDPVTRCYNETMARLLPGMGVEFCEIPRAERGGAPISASRVRRILKEEGGVTRELLALVPACTGAYLLERYGRAGGGA